MSFHERTIWRALAKLAVPEFSRRASEELRRVTNEIDEYYRKTTTQICYWAPRIVSAFCILYVFGDLAGVYVIKTVGFVGAVFTMAAAFGVYVDVYMQYHRDQAYSRADDLATCRVLINLYIRREATLRELERVQNAEVQFADWWVTVLNSAVVTYMCYWYAWVDRRILRLQPAEWYAVVFILIPTVMIPGFVWVVLIGSTITAVFILVIERERL